MAITTGTGLLELLLALLRCLVIPVLGIDIIGDDPVAEVLHRRENVAAGGEVGRTHVCGLYADDVHEGLLELGHLLG